MEAAPLDDADWTARPSDTLTVDLSLPSGTTGRFSAPSGWRRTTGADPLVSERHRLVLRSGS
ncbi:hypothetical protein [Streptomyces sp. NPDC057253]|uniref:hypothetical protein n=1 Tax=Streptomyces sp. NPDC057253 TaxID=3346069 RepID=UPI0036357CA3